MKSIVKRMVTAVALLGAAMSTSVLAEQRIAVVDVQAVFSQLPQSAMIEQTLKTEFKDQIDEVQRLAKDLEYNIEKAQRENATLSDQEKQTLQQQIIALQQNYEAKAKPLDMNTRRRQAEERNKILALIRTAINNIAAEDKYDLVLQSSAVAFIDPADDISGKVIEQVSKIK